MTISQAYRNSPEYKFLAQQSVIIQVKNVFMLYGEFSPLKGARSEVNVSTLCESYYSYCANSKFVPVMIERKGVI